MPKPSEGNRVQFSIRMQVQLKEQLEKLAALRRMSLSDLIEDLGTDAVAKIKPETWQQIEAVIKQVRKESAEASADEGVQLETYRRLKDRKKSK